jgi:hypothetical protein
MTWTPIVERDGSQITIALKQECVIYRPRDLQGVHGKLDTGIAFHSCRLRRHRALWQASS